LIQEEVTFDSIVAQDHNHSEFFSRLLERSAGSAGLPLQNAILPFDTRFALALDPDQ
jgi:hypothetical protein